MTATSAVVALSLVATLVLLAGFWAWLIAAAKAAISWRLVSEAAAGRMRSFLQSLGVAPRLPLIAWNPRRPVPWTAIDLLTLIGLYVLGSAAAAVLAEDVGVSLITVGRFVFALSHDDVLIVLSALASVGILALGLPLISVRTGATPRDYGWSLPRFGSDLKTGIVAFMMLAPPVYVVQGVLVSFWQESKHPLVEMFKKEPSSGFFAVLFVSAAIVAPLFEEMVFRVLLQGFLEKVFVPKNAAAQPMEEAQREVPSPANDQQGSAVVALSPPDNSPYASPQAGDHDLAAAESAAAVERDRGVSWLPVIITSAVFAALHYSHGPDWVPLFFLAMGLGYLYQRTHRLMPSLVVHSLLNAMSMWGLWITVHQAPPS